MSSLTPPFVALVVSLALLSCALSAPAAQAADGLRVGMIGLDTSHVPAFAKVINDPDATGDLAKMRVVAGYPGGTDLPASRDRVERFTDALRQQQIEIVDTIPALLQKVDVVLLESVDGRIHLDEATQVIRAGKPLFIDKPLAGSLVDAIVIMELARRHQVPCFSASSVRFNPGIQELRNNEGVGEIVGAATWGPCSYQTGIPDMFFYGIHGIEGLFALMQPGCVSVTRSSTPGTDVVTGVWKDGRIGTYRGLRQGKAEFGATVFGTEAIVTVDRAAAYEQLCEQIATFFQTHQPPVSPDETIEIFAFMEAADESKRQGGAPVMLQSVLAAARLQAEAKLARLDASRP